MHKILDLISSKTFRNVFCFVTFTVLLTGIISSQNFFFQKVIENGISKTDVIANKDIKVIDTRKTEQHKKEVAQNVEPILTQAEDEFITNSLITLQNSINKIRQKDISNDLKATELSVLFDDNNRTLLVDYLLHASDDDIAFLFDKSKVTLTSVLNSGISYKDFDNNNVPEIIKKNLPNSVTRYKGSLIIGLLNQVIVPNLVIDEYATEIAKKNAQDAVKPYEVVFKKDQPIISEGFQVTKLQRDALRAAGYNILEINFGGLLGIYVLVAFFTFIFLQYERNYERNFYNRKHLTIMATFTLILAFIATVLPTGFSPYIVPIPAYTILLSIFTTPRNAFYASTIVLAMLSIGMQYNTETIVFFLLLNTVVMTAMSRLKFSKRSDLLLISLKISITGILLIGGIYILEKYMMDINNTKIVLDLVYVVLNCFAISGILLLGLLPIIEYLFGVMTPYGLAELADSKLLKKLLQDAPGTYNHSLIVSQLVEAAAEAIGADPVLARVGTMYHDIGKMQRPMFFVENQPFYGIENPHNTCTPRFSKMIITAHPKDGLEIAKSKEYKLPQVIHNFITQHHGTSLVSYFYNEALKEEGADSVNEEQFRYPGPKPNTKETAILMIADAVEAAVRAAKNPSYEDIDNIIQKIIKERLNDGQFDDAPLTIKDLKTIAETLSRMLRGMHHKRIQYHNDLVQELNKNKKSPEIEEKNDDIISLSMDEDLQSKIKELENKKNDSN